MKLQERLRNAHGAPGETYWQSKAADALDAQEARIKALEEALRGNVGLLVDVLLNYHEAARNEWRRKAHASQDRARAALEGKK